MLDYYQNKKSTILNRTARQKWDEGNSALIAMQWPDDPLVRTIKQETAVGTFTFEDVEAQVSTVSTYLSNVIKDSDDWRRIMYKDVTKTVERGTYFLFDDSYWIAYASTETEAAHATNLLRRCNNFLKWVDEDDILHSYPCVVDTILSSTSVKYDKDVNVANGSASVYVQGNIATRTITINRRFIFGDTVWRVAGRNAWLNDGTHPDTAPFIVFDVDLALTTSTDDMENELAGGKAESGLVDTGYDLRDEDNRQHVNSIRVGTTVNFFLYQDGQSIRPDRAGGITFSGPDLSCYNSQVTNTYIIITCLKPSPSPLTITIDGQVVATIRLTALY